MKDFGGKTTNLNVKTDRRRAVSPVIATLLLIAIAVAAAIIVYAFVTGLIGGLTGGSSGLIVESANLSIPAGVATDGQPTTYGSLVLTIKNSGSAPIATITVTETSNTAICDPTVAVCSAADWSGTIATVAKWTPSNAVGFTVIPTGGSQSFTTPITGGTDTANAGTTYTYSVTVTFTTGTSNNIQPLSVVAQT